MDKVVVSREKLTGIADEIRRKTGDGSLLTLDQMRLAIKEKIGDSCAGLATWMFYGYGEPKEFNGGIITTQ